MPYFKALDGFRATAVLAVMLIHARFLPIGWVGVQMFFVLSGFLITGILCAQKEASFKTFLLCFYWRRCLRIWPLYLFYLGVCALGFLLVREPSGFGQNWLSLFTYTFNFKRILTGMQGTDYIGHLWSLCVEEQFYLVWPFVVYFFSPAAFRRIVVALIFLGPVIRALTAYVYSYGSMDPHYLAAVVYNYPTSHIDAFASGAFLATAPAALRSWLAARCRKILLMVVFIAAFLGLAQCMAHLHNGIQWRALGYPHGFEESFQYVWGYTPINLVSAAILLCLLEGAFLPRLFESRWLVYLGRISYGLYVWHGGWLHLLFTRIWPCPPHSAAGYLRLVVFITGTVLLASASYFGFEKRFLALKDRFGMGRSAKPGTDVTSQG